MSDRTVGDRRVAQQQASALSAQADAQRQHARAASRNATAQERIATALERLADAAERLLDDGASNDDPVGVVTCARCLSARTAHDSGMCEGCRAADLVDLSDPHGIRP